MTAAVLTVSDSCASGGRKDASGPAVVRALRNAKFQIVQEQIVPDDREQIEVALRQLSSKAQLVVTTGGTGIATRDVTPEATRAVCSRLVEGLAERIRSEGARKTPMAVLSRGVCGVLGRSLVVNLPGSPSAALESLAAVVEVLPHALELLGGATEHASPAR